MTNILVTDYDGSGEDVMIFTETLTVELVTAKLDKKNQTYNEIYEVPTKEVGLYCYEPCWIEV